MEASKGRGEDPITNVDFSGLILGFSSAALYYLGALEEDGKMIAQKNLSLAMQNIHIVEMLAEKTKGNLNSDEQVLLAEVLKDLRLKYVSASRGA